MAIRKNTHQTFRKKAAEIGITQDKFLQLLMAGNINPNTKTYVYSPEDYTKLSDVADYLFATNNIDRPEVDSATKFAIENLLSGIEKAVVTVKKSGE